MDIFTKVLPSPVLRRFLSKMSLIDLHDSHLAGGGGRDVNMPKKEEDVDVDNG